MNIRRKSANVGLTATLLAALFTIVAAPLVSAAVTVTSVGNVPRGGTATGLVYTFTESTAACLPNAAGSLTVTIGDSAGAAPGGTTVSYSGTAVASGPGSLGTITAAAAAQTLTVSWTASDPLNIESITVSGLGISATTAAALGAIRATLASASLACFQTGGTASGVLASGTPIGTATATVNVTTTGCAFTATGTDIDPGPGVTLSGNYAFAVGAAGTTAESMTGTATVLPAPPAPQVQTLTITTVGGFTSVHNAGDVVTQTNACAPSGVLASPGTVVDSLIYLTATSIPNIFPGENNQLAGSLRGGERTIGFLSVGTVLTFTISTAGVTFGGTLPPVITPNVTGLTFSPVTLNAARTEASTTVLTASTALPLTAADPSFTLSSIRYDVASTVASGTLVNVTLALSGSKVVTPTSRANAQIGRIFNATAAPIPNVNIGQNGQTAGLITITEVTAGSFSGGAGPNNVFEICLDGTASFTSPGPTAFVTGGVAAGMLLLREGAGASPDNIVPGTPDPAAPGCYYWTVWTASTTASTITIGSSATVGPLVNVAAGSPAGPLNATLLSGNLTALPLTTQVSLAIANRVFPGQVQVTAVSQPIIAPGATHALAGDILIQETGNGQLKSGSTICVDIVPNAQTNVIQDVFFSSLTTADLPIATAANGVVIGPVSFSSLDCNPATVDVGTLVHSFRFVISQQSTTGTGKVTISNIHYNVVNDAAFGPVQVNVYGFGVGGTFVDFQRIISNASIGTPVAGTAATRLGVTQVGAFTIATKIQRTGRYVTYRFDFGVAAAGRAIQVWGATKTGNDWSAFTVITTRTANASGVVYYYIRQNSATWRSYRGFNVTAGAWTPARQARWIP